jgi:hypothetical protein
VGERRGPPLRAVATRRRFWSADREVRVWRRVRRGLVVAALLALLLGAFLLRDHWMVRALLTGRELRLAEVCADTPFAAEPFGRAGGLEAARADPTVFDVYLDDVAATDAAAGRIRDHASFAGDDELSVAAATVAVARPHRARSQTLAVERGCAAHVRAAGLTPAGVSD